MNYGESFLHLGFFMEKHIGSVIVTSFNNLLYQIL